MLASYLFCKVKALELPALELAIIFLVLRVFLGFHSIQVIVEHKYGRLWSCSDLEAIDFRFSHF